MTRIELISFGYLHNRPPDAHLTIDLRHHYRDPHLSPDLRYMTAHDAPVRAAVINTPGIKQLLAATALAVEGFLTGPSSGTVTIASGCAGGRHRAATFALALHTILTGDSHTAAELGITDLAQPYGERGLHVTLHHRDLAKAVVER
ncbi:ATPase [Streptomyces sp. NPDC001262]|uniref:RapZ C-terminal domain-containing protein n=1 Tax=Streptomyces sp. NPDC001262 TaxID=3364552 RepID=UPI0036CADAFB